jgi:glucose/arabinose dehydrogenase
MGSPERCAKTEGVALPLQAHSAALGLEFYSGKQFPAPFRDGLYVAYHGSWNRSEPTGYKVVRVVVEKDRPVRVEDFVTGFLQDDRTAWGRPVDVVTGADGALYITDDRANAIYRVAHTGKAAGNE